MAPLPESSVGEAPVSKVDRSSRNWFDLVPKISGAAEVPALVQNWLETEPRLQLAGGFGFV